MDSQATEQQIAEFLVEHRTASLATVDGEGLPHAANLRYVSDDAWNLYWVSSDDSEHSVHLASQPRAAVTIYAPVEQPDAIHGLQMHGRAVALREASTISLVRALYEATYPFAAEPPYREAVAAQTFYRFRPNWARWIDNRRGFGWKYEKTF